VKIDSGSFATKSRNTQGTKKRSQLKASWPPQNDQFGFFAEYTGITAVSFHNKNGGQNKKYQKISKQKISRNRSQNDAKEQKAISTDKIIFISTYNMLYIKACKSAER
jgi:hypothetical protein